MNKLKEIEKWIIWKEDLLRIALSKDIFKQRASEEIFNEIYQRWTVFQEFNLLTEKAQLSFDNVCKIMFGFTFSEIVSIMEKIARRNIVQTLKYNETVIITDEEVNSCEYYHLLTKHNRNFSNGIETL